MSENTQNPELPIAEPIAQRISCTAQGLYIIEAVVELMPDEVQQTVDAVREAFASMHAAGPVVSNVITLPVQEQSDSKPVRQIMPLPPELATVTKVEESRVNDQDATDIKVSDMNQMADDARRQIEDVAA